MEVKRNSTFSSEIQQQQQNMAAMAMENAGSIQPVPDGVWKTVRGTLGSKDCNLAKKKEGWWTTPEPIPWIPLEK